jgi:hypothetical protein
MASGPIERMAYVLGIATAVIGWAGDKLISNLTAAPTIFHALNYVTQADQKLDAEIEIVNLSRDKQLGSLDVQIGTGPRNQSNCIPSNIEIAGLLWNRKQTQPTLQKGAQSDHSVTLQWLMPGSSFTIHVTIPAGAHSITRCCPREIPRFGSPATDWRDSQAYTSFASCSGFSRLLSLASASFSRSGC